MTGLQGAIGETSEWLTNLMASCLDNGMRAPFILSVASRDGFANVLRFHKPGEAPETLVEHPPTQGEGISLPIAGVLMDQTGRALKVVIDEQGAYHEPIYPVGANEN